MAVAARTRTLLRGLILGALVPALVVCARAVAGSYDPAPHFTPASSRVRPVPLPMASHAQSSATGQPGDAADAYLGSGACERCHETEYTNWRRSLHVRMTKPIDEALVVGDFRSGTHLEQYGRAYTMETTGGRQYISVSHGGRPAEKFRVDYTLGARRFQGYLSKLPDGRIYVLPVFWHVESRRWIDWKEITPVPDSDHDLRQIWNVTCFNCHATNLAKNFDVARKAYDTTWTEMGIGCEACHGPGRPHVQLMDQWEADPSSRPVYDKRATNRNLGKILKVFSPRSADRRQVFDSCAYCHGNKTNVFVGFAPGARYEDFALPFLISQPIPDNDPQGDFWPDGRPSRFNRPQALMLSGCFQSGQLTCTNCHVGHGSRNDHALKLPMDQSDGLCTQCHKTFSPPSGGKRTFEGADVSLHTHHAPGSAGSRCVECHMSDVNWRLLNRRRDHTFAAPVPEMTGRFGAPNACTTCHDNRSPEWAAAKMDEWYGNGERRASTVKVADAMYEAGAGDIRSLPRLLGVLVDRRQGAVLRASAAEFIGRFLAAGGAPQGGGAAAGSQTAFVDDRQNAAARPRAPADEWRTAAAPSAVVNALIAGAADPEAIVRIASVRALGLAGDRRALSPLAARLVDKARLVRTSAAEALLSMDVASLDGAAGQALARAQGEYASAMRTFPDVAADHTSLAWLLMSTGQAAEASEELKVARKLEPDDLRARVYQGIIAARDGRLDQALTEWRSVRSADPAYPNIDELIAEAERQLSAPRR